MRSRTALLLYSAVCFVFLSANNLLVVIDILVFPTSIDLGVIRLLATLAGVSTLFAVNQALIALSDYPREDQSLFYLLRFAGFALLVGAIIAKNVRGNRSGS